MIDERTEKRICDLYRYQSLEGYGTQAIEEAHREYQIPRKEVIEILHRNGLALKFGRESEEEKVKASPDKESIMHDYNEGMKVKDIAERYGIKANTLYVNLKSWSKKGLVTLRTPDKPVHIPSPLKTEKEPASAATDTSPCKKISTPSITPEPEIVKSAIDFVDGIQVLYSQLLNWRRDAIVTFCEISADNKRSEGSITFIDEDGRKYRIRLEVAE